MKFFDYLDRLFIVKNVQVQMKFSLKTQSETRAIHDMIGWIRSFFKLVAYVTIPLSYIWCSITKKWPEEPNLEELKKLIKDKEPKAEPSKPTLVSDVTTAT